MLSGLSSYLFGGPSEEGHPAAPTKSAIDLAEASAEAKRTPRLRTTSTEDDWTIVDPASRSSSPAARSIPDNNSPMSSSTHSSSSRGSSQYHVHAHTPSASEDEEEPQPPVRCRHPSLHESWLVTPPPCFTLGGNSPLRLEDNPMENLLIEHPSMSVYQHRGRPNSRGSDDTSEEESEPEDMEVAPSPPTNSTPIHVRPGSRTARIAGVLSGAVAIKNKKSAQAAQKRKEARQTGRHQLDRSNKVQKYNSSSKIPRRKQLMFRANSGRNNDRKCHH